MNFQIKLSDVFGWFHDIDLKKIGKSLNLLFVFFIAPRLFSSTNVLFFLAKPFLMECILEKSLYGDKLEEHYFCGDGNNEMNVFPDNFVIHQEPKLGRNKNIQFYVDLIVKTALKQMSMKRTSILKLWKFLKCKVKFFYLFFELLCSYSHDNYCLQIF